MRKNLKRIAFLLALAVVMMSTVMLTAWAASNENLAYGKDATASSSYPNKPWTADKAVDGNTTDRDSRWASKRATGTTNEGSGDVGTKEQWLQIDLGKTTPIEQVNIYWEAACATSYEIQTSLDGTHFDTVRVCTASGEGAQAFRDLGVEQAKYIRIYCKEPKVARYGYSIFEVEVFAKNRMENAKDVMDSLKGQAPKLAADGKSLILPEVPAGYEISLFGSDNRQVVKLDGTVIQPLVDMEVKVLYKITDTQNPKNFATSGKDISLTIPGKYTQSGKDNAVPNVMPGLREWKGSSGMFTLTKDSRIVVSDTSLDGAAAVIKTYFKDMLGRDISVVNGVAPQKGDIYLKSGNSVENLGDEGYIMEIDEYVTITSPTVTGITYGGASITQILYQDKGMDNAPKGIARDYPKYEVRAGMIDVGRMYVPLEYLEEMTVYMSWFKMNEAHIHINDYWRGSGYSAFRLESEVYPQIVAKDGYYTKNDYRQYQKNMKKYGIDVITEIDTPYHAECFRDVPGVHMLDTGYLDISTDEARLANQKIIERLFDEYLDGEDPVIQSNKFHIGTDEYNKKYSEQMRAWTDHFINYVNGKNYETRLWASLGKNGFNGHTPVSNQATLNLWAPYWADVHEMYNAGYDIINTYGGWLYIVPGANAGYPDRLDLKRLYNQFEVNNFKSGRNPSGEAIMPVAHPQTKGAEFCLWNDMTSFKTGYSWFDIFDRFKAGVALVAEKTWYGEKQEGQTYEQFMERMDALDDKVPNVNPGRHVDSIGDKVANIRFDKDGTDSSLNGYNALLHKMEVKDGAAHFSKDSYLSLPFDTIGYPYTVSLSVNLTEMDKNTALFSGADGVLYADIDGTGKVGFKRGAYRFSFNYELPKNEWVTLTFVGNAQNTTLYVNGVSKGAAKLMDPTIGGKTQKSSTFVMPFEKVMVNAVGSMDDLVIYDYAMTATEVQESLKMAKWDNLALNKEVEVSGLEVSDGRFTAEKAVDGIVSKDSRVSFAKDKDEQWMIVNLGKVYPVSQIVIQFESQVSEYKIEVSVDGKEYHPVYAFKDDKLAQGGSSGVHTITLDEPVEAQYIRYTQLKRWKHTGNGNYYSGSIYEFEVYQSTNAELKAYVEAAMKEFAKYTPGAHNGNAEENFYTASMETLNKYLALAEAKDQISAFNFMRYKQIVLELQQELPQHILVVPQDAVDAYEAAEKLDRGNYTASSYEQFKQALEKVSLDNLTTVEAVDAAIQAVEDAKNLLVQVNNAELRALVAEALKVNLDLCPEQVKKEFQDALNNAIKTLEAPESQAAIDNAAAALQSAMKKLNPADKSALKDLIAKAETMDLTGYTAESVQAFKDALKAAQNVLANENLSKDEQAVVDEAVAKLVGAIDGLTTETTPPQPENPEPENPEKPNPEKPEPEKPEPPKTGDNSHIMIAAFAAFTALAGASCAAVALFDSNKRRHI